MSIKDLQRAWKTSLCDNDTDELTHYLEGDELSVKERLSVYQHAYWVRLVNTLSHAFPLLRLEMGNNAFREMSVAYLQTHAPSGFSLHQLGEELPTYLSAHYGEDDPLVELAAWELMVRQIRLETNTEWLSITGIRERLMKNEPLLLQAHPSMRFFTQQYNTAERWLAFSEKQARPKQAALAEPVCHVVWRRQDYCIRTMPICDGSMHEFQQLLKGQSLMEWCESSDSAIPVEQAIQDLTAKVVAWAEQGLLADSVS